MMPMTWEGWNTSNLCTLGLELGLGLILRFRSVELKVRDRRHGGDWRRERRKGRSAHIFGAIVRRQHTRGSIWASDVGAIENVDSVLDSGSSKASVTEELLVH